MVFRAKIELPDPQLRPGKLPLGVTLLRDDLEAVAHHGDEHVQQDNDVAHGVGPEHEQGPEPGELLDARQLKVGEVDEAEGRPEQGLRRLEEVGEAAPDDARVALE